jgi:NAD/NADP transhydrogenase beta subunit
MIETAYAFYLAITVGITAWVARTLSRNGEIFLVQCFGHNRELAHSTNHLLVVGFYLVNIGFITLTLSIGAEPTTMPEAISFLSSKVGLAVLVLGGMHFFNMSAIAHFGRKVNAWFVEQQVYAPDLPARPEPMLR